MTSLSDLNSGLVTNKGYINPVVGTLKASTILSGTNISVIPMQAGSVNITGGGTLPLTASDVVGGVFGFINTTIINLPSATDIQNFIGPLPPEIIFYSFTFKVYVSLGNQTFNVGTGMQTYNSLSSFTYSPTNYHDIVFAFTPLGWKVFY